MVLPLGRPKVNCECAFGLFGGFEKIKDQKREKPFGAHGEWRPSTAELGKQLSGPAHRKKLCSSPKEAVAENFTPTRPCFIPRPFKQNNMAQKTPKYPPEVLRKARESVERRKAEAISSEPKERQLAEPEDLPKPKPKG